MEYKVGDFVTCLEGFNNDGAYVSNKSGGSGYKVGKVIQIDRIDPPYKGKGSGILWPKEGCGIYEQAVRASTIEEVEQYVKDNKCSIEEILEICKNLYPVGTKFKCVYGNIGTSIEKYDKLTNTWEVTYHKNQESNGVHSGNGWLYYNNKFARIVNQEEELPFKVGDKFYYINHPENHWTITAIKDGKVYCNEESCSDRTIQNVVRYITIDKIWLPYKPSLKKEDFYNTKIDVSESEELSKAVQEKLFELGFTWQSGDKYVSTKFIYITGDYEGTLYIASGRKYKQIYPQDLGININNKKQTNNVNNKETTSKTAGISKVQGFNQQISEPSRTRGIGLERTRSKISLGVINSPNKVGLG